MSRARPWLRSLRMRSATLALEGIAIPPSPVASCLFA